VTNDRWDFSLGVWVSLLGLIMLVVSFAGVVIGFAGTGDSQRDAMLIVPGLIFFGGGLILTVTAGRFLWLVRRTRSK
jgi:hypothetical protein